MNNLTYRMNGDYRIPNLTLSEQNQPPLSKYGMMRKAYLQEHRPVLWNNLILTEKLYPPSAGSRTDSEEPAGTDDDGAGEGSRSDGSIVPVLPLPPNRCCNSA